MYDIVDLLLAVIDQEQKPRQGCLCDWHLIVQLGFFFQSEGFN